MIAENLKRRKMKSLRFSISWAKKKKKKRFIHLKRWIAKECRKMSFEYLDWKKEKWKKLSWRQENEEEKGLTIIKEYEEVEGAILSFGKSDCPE